MPKTQEHLRQEMQRVARLESELARNRLTARKQETRRKIEWGGLVVKSGLSHYSKAVILGALVDAFTQIQEEGEGAKQRYQHKGEAAFMGFNV